MSWFEAYLLWSLNSFIAFSVILGAVSVLTFLMAYVLPFGCYAETVPDAAKKNYDGYQKDYDEYQRRRKIVFRAMYILLPLMALCWLVAAVTPSTETVLKIIATKKGVDAVQSQTFQGYVDKSAAVIDNSLKLLNQTIEKRLDKPK